jgi:hypothetical protein
LFGLTFVIGHNKTPVFRLAAPGSKSRKPYDIFSNSGNPLMKAVLEWASSGSALIGCRVYFYIEEDEQYDELSYCYHLIEMPRQKGTPSLWRLPQGILTFARHNVSTCPTSTVVGYHGLLKNNPVAEP